MPQRLKHHRRSQAALPWLLSLVAAATLAGCTTPGGPQFMRPTVEVPSQWRGSDSRAAATPSASLGDAWWLGLGSPELERLIDIGLADNRDLHILVARVAQARALTDSAAADRRPQLGAMASAQRGRDSAADPKTDSTAVGLRARWEVDLLGRGELARQATAADAGSAELALQAARTMLAADVAQAYVELQSLQRRRELASATLALAERQQAVAQRRFDAGLAPSLDVERWQAEQAQERAALIQLETEQRLRHQQLALLLGRADGPALNGALPDVDAIAAPPPTVPARLLERRPDVNRQARALDAALARLGVARQEIYPRLVFEWAADKQRLALAGGGAAPQMVLGYGLTLSLPLLDGGRIRASIDLHEARVQEAMAEYEKALLTAATDVESALARWSGTEGALASARAAEQATARAERHGQRLFDAGQLDLGSALDVHRQHLRAQDATLRAQAARWAAAVDLRRAMMAGGSAQAASPGV